MNNNILLENILRACGAEQYIDAIVKHGIDSYTLKILTEEDLILVGVENEETRKKILKHIFNLQIPGQQTQVQKVDKSYILVCLSQISLQLQRHIANITYAYKRPDVDLCAIHVAPVVRYAKRSLVSLEQELDKFEEKILHKNRRRKKFAILIPTLVITTGALFICIKYTKVS